MSSQIITTLPRNDGNNANIIGWGETQFGTLGTTFDESFRYKSLLNRSTVDVLGVSYNTNADRVDIYLGVDTDGVASAADSVFPDSLQVSFGGFFFNKTTTVTAKTDQFTNTAVRFQYEATGASLASGVAPSPELTIQHELGVSQTLNYTGRRFIDRDRDSQYFYHTQYDVESINYQIDFSRPLTDHGASIATVEWSVKYGSATLTNQITKDDIAQITVANPKSGKALIQCKVTDINGSTRVRYIEIKVIDPDYTLKDYGS